MDSNSTLHVSQLSVLGTRYNHSQLSGTGYQGDPRPPVRGNEVTKYVSIHLQGGEGEGGWGQDVFDGDVERNTPNTPFMQS